MSYGQSFETPGVETRYASPQQENITIPFPVELSNAMFFDPKIPERHYAGMSPQALATVSSYPRLIVRQKHQSNLSLSN